MASDETPKRNWRKAEFKLRSNLPVQEILETLRLDEMLDALGLNQGKDYKGKIQMRCPLPSHPGADSTPSFAIMREGLSYNCYVCGSGRITDLVRQLQGYDTDEEALVYMMDFGDASVADESHQKFLKRGAKNLKRPEKKITLPDRAPDLPWFNPDLLEPYQQAAVHAAPFWNERHISLRVVEDFMLGYDPEYEKRDYVGPAVIIPHFVRGVLTGWQARWLSDDRPKYIPKYDNTDEFPKAHTIYNYDRARTREGPTYVVESTLTVARLETAQITAVATFGASISDFQIKLLAKLAEEGIIVSYDDDEAGDKATNTLIEKLSPRGFVDVIPPHILNELSGQKKTDLGDLDDAQLVQATEFRIPHYVR